MDLQRRSFVLGSIAAATLPVSLQAQTTARYTGALVLRPLSSGRLMELEENFGYIDAQGQEWPVPAGAIVDGASIPRVLWPIVGAPFTGLYRDASVVHDWYCAVRTRPWKQTHQMFHEAMLTSQVSSAQARIMYLAVRYAGPSWDDLTIRNSRILTNDGKRRLYAPGQQAYTSNFATEAESQARDTLIADFNALAEQVSTGQLDIRAIDALVESHGRAEDAAYMLSPE